MCLFVAHLSCSLIYTKSVVDFRAFRSTSFKRRKGCACRRLNRIVARFRETLAARSAYSLIIQKSRPAVQKVHCL